MIRLTRSMFVVALILHGSLAVAAESGQIAQWIEELGSEVYQVREAAMQQLMAAGPAALEQVAKAADGNNLEVATRAVRILLELSDSDNAEVSLVAIKRLALLKNRPIEAAEAQAWLAARQEAQSLEEVLRLGAQDRGSFPVDGQRTIAHLHIGEHWRGGDEGLEHVGHLSSVIRLSIHGAPISNKGLKHLLDMEHLRRIELFGTKVTLAGVEKLRQTLPEVEIDFRGGAMLGVSGAAAPQGVLITLVQAGTAADRVGLQAGDVITQFGGKKIQTFEELTACIAVRAPGDKVEVEFLRGDQTITKTVEFGRWK